MEILHPTHKSSSPDFIPRVWPQNSAPEFSPSSVLGPGTCLKAYNLIQSQDAWLELKNECYKKLVKKFSLSLLLPPPSLLLTTRSAELKLSALKKNIVYTANVYRKAEKISCFLYTKFCKTLAFGS